MIHRLEFEHPKPFFTGEPGCFCCAPTAPPSPSSGVYYSSGGGGYQTNTCCNGTGVPDNLTLTFSSTDFSCVNGQTLAIRRNPAFGTCYWETFGGLNAPTNCGAMGGRTGIYAQAAWCGADGATSSRRWAAKFEKLTDGTERWQVTISIQFGGTTIGIPFCNSATQSVNASTATTCSPFLWSNSSTWGNMLNVCNLCGGVNSGTVNYTVTA